MKSTFIFTLLFVLAIHSLYAQTNSVSVIGHWQDTIPAKDWLIHSGDFKAKVSQTNNGKEVYLYNGLLKRKFVISGSSLGCTDYKNLINGQQLLRAISPEAKFTINAV